MLILLLALLPTILSILFIMYIDRMRPEPIKYLIWAFVGGMLSILPAMLFEMILTLVLGNSVIGISMNAAVVEEVCKFAVLWYILNKFKPVDEYIDCIVYAVCVGVGFEFVENLMYFTQFNESIVSRILAPGHFIFAILMGYYLGKSYFAEQKDTSKLIAYSLLVPMLAHFIWDFIAFLMEGVSEDMSAILLIVFFGFYFYILRMSIRRVKETHLADVKMHEMERQEEIREIKKEGVEEYLEGLDNRLAEATDSEAEKEENEAHEA